MKYPREMKVTMAETFFKCKTTSFARFLVLLDVDTSHSSIRLVASTILFNFCQSLYKSIIFLKAVNM